MADCHSSYREPYCTAPGIPSAPAFCGGYGTETVLEYTFTSTRYTTTVLCPISGVLLIISQLHIGDKVADCHFSYREPHCRPPKVAPTLAFWGAYAAGARERDGRLPGIGPSRKWGALKRLREGGYVREFARRARWPFAMRSAKAATRDGRLPGTRPARWPFARHPATDSHNTKFQLLNPTGRVRRLSLQPS